MVDRLTSGIVRCTSAASSSTVACRTSNSACSTARRWAVLRSPAERSRASQSGPASVHDYGAVPSGIGSRAIARWLLIGWPIAAMS